MLVHDGETVRRSYIGTMGYYEKIVEIEGLETGIIDIDKMDMFFNDSMLQRTLSINCKDILEGMIECCNLYDLRLGILKREYPNRDFYMPTLCMRFENDLYHVFYKDNWICRECGCDNGKVIMPLVETGDGFIYPDRKNVKIPRIFLKVPCKLCGKILQNHILLV